MNEPRRYGPPPRQPRAYPVVLELLEARANKKLVDEYKHDICDALAHLEASSDINPAMIDLQPEIQWFMRPFLLDFIVELHASFKLQPQTLFRCFNVVDRYCAKRIVFKRHYQLVGCTALWIAAKYEDKKSRVPTLKELSIMCRNAYDEEMFVQMERHILSTLEWALGRPTLEECLQLSVQYFIEDAEGTPQRYTRHSSDGPNSLHSAVTAVTRFLCELSLYHRDFLEFETSQVAATANLIACSMLQIPNAARQLERMIALLRHHQPSNENASPEVVGAFLSGFDNGTVDNLRKITLLFAYALKNITDVLSTKYKALGVLQVVQNFIIRNNALSESLGEDFNPSDTSMTAVADYFLGLTYVSGPKSNSLSSIDNMTPITPPSTSRSIFSEAPSSSPLHTPGLGPLYAYTPKQVSPQIASNFAYYP